MHLHGAGHKYKRHSQWLGISALTLMGGMMVMAVFRIGWLAFAPFVLGVFILGVALWFMRTIF